MKNFIAKVHGLSTFDLRAGTKQFEDRHPRGKAFLKIIKVLQVHTIKGYEFSST